MDAQQMAQMAQMEAAYAAYQQQIGHAAPHGAPAGGPYGGGGQVRKPAPVQGVHRNHPNEYTDEDWGVPGFGQALSEAVMPVSHTGAFNSDEIEDIKNKLGKKILKAANKFAGDERLQETKTGLMARSIVEEYVDWSASAVSQAFYDKPWLEKVNLAAPLLASCLHTFSGARMFTRTLAPMLPKYIEEALFRYAEEERISKAMFDAVVGSGVKESYHKKASTHLSNTYAQAHIKAPYGATSADTAEIGMLQDFVKGWMFEFVDHASDILNWGIASEGSKPTKADQVLFVTVLFQNLTDSRNAALPHELTALIETPPPSPWTFIAETAESVFDEVDAARAKRNKEREEWQRSQSPMAQMGMGMKGGNGGMAAMEQMGMMMMNMMMMGMGGMGGKKK